MRFSHEKATTNGKVELLPVDLKEADAAINELVNRGLERSAIKVKANGSDQLIMRIN